MSICVKPSSSQLPVYSWASPVFYVTVSSSIYQCSDTRLLPVFSPFLFSLIFLTPYQNLSPTLNFGFFPRRVFASKKTNSKLYWDSTSMSPSAVKCSLLICVYKHSSLCPLLHNALVTISHSFDNKVDRSILPNGTVTITINFICC